MKKILIIEDDINISALEQDYLEANSFEVKTAADGINGLSLALNEDFDLVLLDIMLPGMDGLKVCTKLREKKDIPIIMVSAKRDDIDKIKGLGFGADDYIVKPFSPGELVARVIAHINRYERLTSNPRMLATNAKQSKSAALSWTAKQGVPLWMTRNWLLQTKNLICFIFLPQARTRFTAKKSFLTKFGTMIP